jgi:hypothetical protein
MPRSWARFDDGKKVEPGKVTVTGVQKDEKPVASVL